MTNHNIEEQFIKKQRMFPYWMIPTFPITKNNNSNKKHQENKQL